MIKQETEKAFYCYEFKDFELYSEDAFMLLWWAYVYEKTGRKLWVELKAKEEKLDDKRAKKATGLASNS